MGMLKFMIRFSAVHLLVLLWAFSLRAKTPPILGLHLSVFFLSAPGFASLHYLGSSLMYSHTVLIFCPSFLVPSGHTWGLALNFAEVLNSFFQLVFIEWQIYARCWRYSSIQSRQKSLFSWRWHSKDGWYDINTHLKYIACQKVKPPMEKNNMGKKDRRDFGVLRAILRKEV